MPLATPPLELFDLVDERGAPLGRTKAREQVHRDGDWHRSLHLWVVLQAEGEPPRLLLQRRSATKDTWPGRLDVSVAGHLAAGETESQALREAEEELGLRVPAHEACRIGERVSVLQEPPVFDRELQGVWVTVARRPFASLTPDPSEVSSVVALDEPHALALLSGARASAPCLALLREPHGWAVLPAAAHAHELIPGRAGYQAEAARCAFEWAAGRRPNHLPMRWGG